MLPRHLPPTATPLPPHVFVRGVLAPADAHARLQERLTELLGLRHCRFASSGRTALYLLLAALGTQADSDRTEVCLPAYTCPSVAKVILEAQLKPVLIDIEPTTLAMDEDGLAAAVTGRTLAVIVVHPFGLAHPLTEASALAKAAGAAVIEDVAQSMGAANQGRSLGTLGDYGLFSLGPGKALSAGGGGFVCANGRENAERLTAAWARLPNSNWTANAVALARLAVLQSAFQPAGWWLAMKAGAQRMGDDEANWGFSLSALSAAQAAIAAAQLPRLDAYNRRRRVHAAFLISGLRSLPGVAIPPALVDSRPTYLRLPLIFDDAAVCHAVHDALQAAGVGAGRMYKRTLAALFPTLAGQFAGAEAVARGLLTLPTHHHLRSQDLVQMIEIVRAQTEAATRRTRAVTPRTT